jgi:hypothetical protein
MPRVSQAELTRETLRLAEASYLQLEGRWRTFIDVAKRFERKAMAQDRLDLRHTIALELAKAEKRTGTPLREPQMYRIASYMVAEYWRKTFTSVNRLPCGKCPKSQRQKCLNHNLYGQCTKAVTIASLDADVKSTDGQKVSLADTLIDDKAVDLPQWLDTKTFLLGCPKRLMVIAVKKVNKKPLTVSERKYLSRWRKSQQLKLL